MMIPLRWGRQSEMGIFRLHLFLAWITQQGSLKTQAAVSGCIIQCCTL
ncbi:hypothetical protein [Kingella sp. (in: b-proteobacteria)]|nr:hypothetical protein [Kingella sp. (in: b-proteobacteria)]MDO4658094.1 hypothetical protein [Kingella sp. (in: b-proteobacteria)]